MIPADADLKKYNSDWQQKHAQSPSHQQSALNVRHYLDDGSKPQNEAELQKLLDLPSITIEQAEAGLNLLAKWKSDEKTKTSYRQAASKK